MKIRLTESKLKQIISESVKAILNENSPLKSKKLHDIFKQHGHTQYSKHAPWDKVTDDMILGVYSREQYNRMKSDGSLEQFGMEKNASVEGDVLEDGNILVYVNPSYTRNKSEYWDLRDKREKSQRGDGIDRYYPQGDKGKAARELYTNPYIWSDKKKQRENSYNEVGWPDAAREKLIDLARQGKDRWSPEFKEFVRKRENKKRNRDW